MYIHSPNIVIFGGIYVEQFQLLTTVTAAAPAAWEGQAGTGGTDVVEAGNRCQSSPRERAHEEEK